MADEQPLTLHEGNDETLLITVVRQDADDDLTGVTTLELYLKPDSCSDDDGIYTLVLSSANPGEIAITEQTAAQITAVASIPAAALAEPYDRFWRLDGLFGATRRTAMYGNVTVVDL